jgi:uncharacterized protein
MLSTTDQEKLQQFFSGKPVKKAFLFGSYARNTEIEDVSDIDILVELDYSRHIGFEFIQMVLDLERILHKKVDLVATDGLSKYVKPFVQKDKVLIYERAAKKPLNGAASGNFAGTRNPVPIY